MNPLPIEYGKVYQIEANAKELSHLAIENGTITLKALSFRGITAKKVSDYRRDTGFKLVKGLCGENGTYSFKSIRSPLYYLSSSPSPSPKNDSNSTPSENATITTDQQ